MSIWQTPLGINLINNPLVDSPYSAQYDFGNSYPVPGAYDLLTEGGSFILIENGEFLTTE